MVRKDRSALNPTSKISCNKDLLSASHTVERKVWKVEAHKLIFENIEFPTSAFCSSERKVRKAKKHKLDFGNVEFLTSTFCNLEKEVQKEKYRKRKNICSFLKTMSF